jgi:hypothetical protein
MTCLYYNNQSLQREASRELRAALEFLGSYVVRSVSYSENRKTVENKMKALSVAMVAFAGTLGSVVNAADAIDIGKREYTENCAACHGVSGKGDGPFAGIINQQVTDLTKLAKENNGTFPFVRVYEVIDGTREAKAHGTRDMPIWGSVYNAQAPQWLGFDYAQEDAQTFVRGRILSLIGHIDSIQEQ